MDTWQALHAFEKLHVGPGAMANGKRHQATNIVIEPVSDTEVPHLMATGRHDKSAVVKTAKGGKFKRPTLKVDPGFFRLMDEAKAGQAA